MNNVLVVSLNKNSFGGTLCINNTIIGGAKIDTGCTFTSIPLMYFGYDEDECKRLKKLDIESFRDGKIDIMRSLGVETNKDKVFPSIYSMTDEEIFLDETICFIHNGDLKFNDFYLGNVDFKVNYDRYNHGLVGMNVLRLFDFYCGYSRYIEILCICRGT